MDEKREEINKAIKEVLAGYNIFTEQTPSIIDVISNIITDKIIEVAKTLEADKL